MTTPNFAQKYGIPAENIINADFIEAATIKPGTKFITRPAPGIGANAGGGIEVVVPEGGVVLKSFEEWRADGVYGCCCKRMHKNKGLFQESC